RRRPLVGRGKPMQHAATEEGAREVEEREERSRGKGGSAQGDCGARGSRSEARAQPAHAVESVRNAERRSGEHEGDDMGYPAPRRPDVLVRYVSAAGVDEERAHRIDDQRQTALETRVSERGAKAEQAEWPRDEAHVP